ncbi:MAG TPA: phosphoenolpyruvate--protein phosphotransferase [Candidatus Hydrogenedentes bacterium]|nr:phosphoenolpyruvate--protein phosphotransferase [Candidatus Hydrogenedentota bacterium]
MEQTFRGIGVSPGIAIGPALLFDTRRHDVPKFAIDDTKAELERVDRAIEATRNDLTLLYSQTAKHLGKTHASIFNAHLMLLDDVAIREEITQRIQAEHINAEYILNDLTQRYQKVLESAKDPRFHERTADLIDVTGRVLHYLMDAERPNLHELATPSIIIAHDLSPSDAASMNLENTLGLATDIGSVTSHTAILARALEVPAAVGMNNLSEAIQTGSTIVVDGSEGLVIINPSPATIKRYRAERELLERKRLALQRIVEAGPCHTLDGVEVPLYANIELPIEIAHSQKVNAQGIGLYRTEYLFLNRDALPTEEEQYEAYAEAARAMNPLPVTLRTIDVGGDKLVAHIHMSKEENPQLGWRAVRFCLQRPDIFKTQLRAMLRASVHGNVNIMFPMISGLEELRQVKAILWEVRDDLKRHRIPVSRDIKVGSMIEVPSAVTLTDLLAKECDFFSIGTNDLIQYSLAVDRVNEKIAHLYEPAHPAVLRMIRWTANSAAAEGIPCSICGEMGGDPLFTELLLGLGVTSLSMSAIALPLVRAEASQTNLQEAQALAKRILRLATSTEVKSLLRERFERKGAIEAYLAKSRPKNPKETTRRG